MQKELEVEYVVQIHMYAKVNNKYRKNYDKNKESSFIQYLDANNFYGWAMSQIVCRWFEMGKKYILKFNEDFIKIMMKIVIKDIFLK